MTATAGSSRLWYQRMPGLSFFLSILLSLATLPFLPGVAGPYVFDDATNILDNDFVKVHELTPSALYHAGFSLEAGPLRRPVSMISFALNYRFAGTFADPTPYKLTNIAIHLLNGLLVFWMMRLIFNRAHQTKCPGTASGSGQRVTVGLAFGTAFLWMVHPIQVSSVLYLVQRMTELAATFTLGGTICYMKGRELQRFGQTGRGLFWITFGLVVCGILGIYSKENAILLPLFVLIVDFTLFPDEAPWNLWQTLSKEKKALLIVVLLLLITAVGAWALQYAAPSYRNRDFSMGERILTEGRVVFYYIGLILIPRISAFGNQHDDISLSTSLVDPWTTAPALLGHAVMLIAALAARRRLPIFCLGVLWFYAGHLIESTILSLEIAHEHRNYLPSLGVMLALAGLIDNQLYRSPGRRWIWIMPSLAAVLIAVTTIRAYQWGSEQRFYFYEVVHHPESARSQAGYARLLVAEKRYDEAIMTLRTVAALDPHDVTPLAQITFIRAIGSQAPVPEDQARILADLGSSKPIPAGVFLLIQDKVQCLDGSCKGFRKPMEQWLRTIIGRRESPGDNSFYRYALGLNLLSQGQTAEGIRELRLSHQLDPNYLHPLFALANIYVRLGMIQAAEATLTELRRANLGNPYPRPTQIDSVAMSIDRLKSESVKRNVVRLK